MAEKLENCFLVNAPAGSGKTTTIRTMVTKSLATGQQDQILCITFTNRAADELSKLIDSPKIFIGTIHAFLHSFIQHYLKHQEILDLYFEMFGEKINQRIEDPIKNQSEGNERYREIYGELTYDQVRTNIKEISYNESPFTSLYYGGLSHDDLIKFSFKAFMQYPALQQCLAAKYQKVFIDEYQDTFAEVLKLFFMSIQGTTTKLYLFGDPMQQIYKNYDGSFEDELNLFDQSIKLNTNYRSIPTIVDLLNNIYNDPDIKQCSSEEMKKLQTDQMPQVIFCENVQKALELFEIKKPKPLLLRLFNKDRFKAIGAENLFTAISKMDRYTYHKAHNAVDVLTTDYLDNPDPLIKLLFFIEEIHRHYSTAQFGLIIKNLKAERTMIAPESYMITSHQEKLDFQTQLEELSTLLKKQNTTIGGVLSHLQNKGILQGKYYDEIKQITEYEPVCDIPFEEIVNVANYLRDDPTVSTQHGVKGESHDSVVFVAEGNKRTPVVHMYEFFDIWCRVDITLNNLQKLYYAYAKDLKIIQNNMGSKISELNKDSFSEQQNHLIEQANVIVGQYSKNPIFRESCLGSYLTFLKTKNVTTAKACFKDNAIYGIISAYKLFYVGCSRARKNLVILIDRSKIIGDKVLFKEKLEQLGFEVQDQSEGI